MCDWNYRFGWEVWDVEKILKGTDVIEVGEDGLELDW